MAKRKRQPNRTPREHIEDYFFDATLAEQAEIMKILASLHRMKQRLVGSIAEAAIQAGEEAAEQLPLEAKA